MLKLRRQQKGKNYNLLLASTISLTPNMLNQICASKSWTKFRSYLQNIGPGSGDLIHLLTKYIDTNNNVDGYRGLAYLIKEGYFSTILTTNLDATLEDALLEIGMQPNTFQTFIVGRDQNEYISKALNGYPKGIHIIKLHGSLRERVLPKQFPDIFELPEIIQESLENYLNQDIVIVGSTEHDGDIIRAFNAREKSRIYYITQRRDSQDSITRLIKARGYDISTSLISGAYGEFTTFFQMLESIVRYDAQDNTQLIQLRLAVAKHIVISPKALIADVLLVTVTEVEARSILERCPENKLRFIGSRVYYDLGIIGGASVFMIQSEMGSDGLGGSRFTVEEGISALSPAAVVMVGIAFGVDEKKQHIGDILVSRQLVGYDLQRVGSNIEGKINIYLRGERVSAPIKLLDRFKAGFKTWQEPPYVHFGLILSGAKLIDNQDFRDQLCQIERGAIGGEMEGVGLYEATQRYSVDWMLVKAICDWADGSKHQDKDERQKEAAGNAASFVLHVIQAGDFHAFKQASR